MTQTHEGHRSHQDRLGVVDHDGRGTPAAEWAAWGRRFPELDLRGWTRLVVVAPHPDDEVLGVGGLMQRAADAGVEVVVVAVTDGTAAVPHGPWTPDQLGEVRVREHVAACTVVGVAPPVRLGLPDGAVADHERTLGERLAELLDAQTVCVATWSADGHPDHEASGRAAAAACGRTGARLIAYPVWTWHWSRPDDPAVPWDRARELRLSPAEQEAKARAVQCHRSQLEPPLTDPDSAPVLPGFVIERLVRDREVFW